MKFIFASGNAHKAQEINELFDGVLEISAAVQKLEVIEDADTFQENAYKKAKAYYDSFGMPTLADDSGLVIPQRPDIMGVHSARFAPEYEDYKDKNRVLLEELKDLYGDERNAYFTCYLCFILSEKEVYFFEGRVHGKIATEAKGDKGFGYDPVFLPDGEHLGASLAQLEQWKMKNSHRAKACQEAIKFFRN